MTIGDKTYKVDGFCEETNTVYEFYGCFWHGCPKCYRPNIINSKNQKDMGTLNDQTIEKRETIKNAGYNHVSTYECQLAKNKDFRKFTKNFTQEIVEPLSPRDAFYGGRTNATKLLYNFKDNECGRYVDFCSLYPTGARSKFWGVSGLEDRGGGDNNILFINIGRGVTKVLKNCDEK